MFELGIPDHLIQPYEIKPIPEIDLPSENDFGYKSLEEIVKEGFMRVDVDAYNLIVKTVVDMKCKG